MPEFKILSSANSPQAQANDRGKLFERLMRSVLRSYGFEIDDISVNYAGMEIDIEGADKISRIPLYAECKFYEKAIDSPKFQAFFGKYMSRWKKNRKAIGLFIAIPGLNSHATAFYKENCDDDDDTTVNLLEKDKVLESLYASETVARPEYIALQIPEEIGKAGDQILVYTEQGFFWVQFIIPVGSVIPTSTAIFDSRGRSITGKQDLEIIRKLLPELEEFEPIKLETFVPKQLLTPSSDLEQIVEVKGGSECFEYQFPSAPEFFVGRDDVLIQVDNIVSKIVSKQTSSRGILFTANSGWGKSSTVLASVNRLTEAGHFALAIDSRAASTSQFILKVIEHVLEKHGNFNGIIAPEEMGELSGFDGAVNILIQIGRALEAVDKVLVIYLDQFENLFFQLDALRRIKDVFLKVCDVQTNIVFGFSWKIDIIGHVNSFPYQLREEITSASHSIPIAVFSDTETDALLGRLEKEMRTKLRKDLKFFISDFSQGFPWLLKKLCAHVKTQYENGVLQASLANSLLNVEEIFLSDLRVLQPEEEDTLRRIAKLVPINAMDLGEEFNPTIVQTLVNRRLLIRVGTKYDIYWDIFRDYLNTGRLPVQENYLLRVAASTVLKEFRRIHRAIQNQEPLSIDSYQANHSTVSQRTFHNVLHELKLLGMVDTNSTGNLVLQVHFENSDLSFEQALQNHLFDRLQRNRLISRLVEILDKEDIVYIDQFAGMLRAWCPYISASNKTWKSYAKTFAGWLKAAGLAGFDHKNLVLIKQEPDSVLSEYSLLDVELGIRNHTGIPTIQHGAVEKVLIRIVNSMETGDRIDLSGISTSTWTKALASLEGLGFIVRQPRSIGVLPKALQYVNNERDRRQLFAEQAMNMRSFRLFVNILRENDEHPLSLLELGRILGWQLGVDWADGTAEVNAKIMMNWARYADLAPTTYKGRRRSVSKHQKSLFED